MTKPVNFPGRKNQRRIKALERLENQIEKEKNLYPEGNMSIILKEGELSILEERISKGGKKSTKKVHANTGWKTK